MITKEWNDIDLLQIITQIRYSDLRLMKCKFIMVK